MDSTSISVTELPSGGAILHLGDSTIELSAEQLGRVRSEVVAFGLANLATMTLKCSACFALSEKLQLSSDAPEHVELNKAVLGKLLSSTAETQRIYMIKDNIKRVKTNIDRRLNLAFLHEYYDFWGLPYGEIAELAEQNDNTVASEWLQGQRLQSFFFRNPEVYMETLGPSDNAMGVGLRNFRYISQITELLDVKNINDLDRLLIERPIIVPAFGKAAGSIPITAMRCTHIRKMVKKLNAKEISFAQLIGEVPIDEQKDRKNKNCHDNESLKKLGNTIKCAFEAVKPLRKALHQAKAALNQAENYDEARAEMLQLLIAFSQLQHAMACAKKSAPIYLLMEVLNEQF